MKKYMILFFTIAVITGYSVSSGNAQPTTGDDIYYQQDTAQRDTAKHKMKKKWNDSTKNKWKDSTKMHRRDTTSRPKPVN